MTKTDFRDAGATRYGSLSIGLHWLMLLLIAAVYACIEWRGIFPRGSGARQMMQTWHFMLGLSVLVLATLRLLEIILGVLRFPLVGALNVLAVARKAGLLVVTQRGLAGAKARLDVLQLLLQIRQFRLARCEL